MLSRGRAAPALLATPSLRGASPTACVHRTSCRTAPAGLRCMVVPSTDWNTSTSAAGLATGSSENLLRRWPLLRCCWSACDMVQRCGGGPGVCVTVAGRCTHLSSSDAVPALPPPRHACSRNSSCLPATVKDQLVALLSLQQHMHMCVRSGCTVGAAARVARGCELSEYW